MRHPRSDGCSLLNHFTSDMDGLLAIYPEELRYRLSCHSESVLGLRTIRSPKIRTDMMTYKIQCEWYKTDHTHENRQWNIVSAQGIEAKGGKY